MSYHVVNHSIISIQQISYQYNIIYKKDKLCKFLYRNYAIIKYKFKEYICLYKLKIKFKEDVDFKDRNNYLHKIFSTIFHEENSKNKKKKNYTFFIERFKLYQKDKIYKIDLHTSNPNIDELLKENAIKFKEIIEIEEKDYKPTEFIMIENINFPIHSIVLDNWNIKDYDKTKRQQYYHKDYGTDLLKELIEYQIYSNTSLNVKPNVKTKNGKDYFSFIKNIILEEPKNEFTVKYNVLIQLNNDKQSKLLSRELVFSGTGAKNSFGFGFANYRRGL